MSFSRLFALAAGASLSAAAAGAHAAPLTMVNVSAPAINCVFNPTCTTVVNDSVGNIPLPGTADKGRLQSRTFPGVAGAPANGLTGYEYRIDLTNVAGLSALPCVTGLKVDSAPVATLHYPNGGPLAQVYVVTGGGLGTVAPASADLTGSVLTFTFKTPVCGGQSHGKGQTSFFFGVAAKLKPVATTAKVRVTPGGAWVPVPARSSKL